MTNRLHKKVFGVIPVLNKQKATVERTTPFMNNTNFQRNRTICGDSLGFERI